MPQDLEREFPSASPRSDERQGHINPLEDPAVQEEIYGAKPPHSVKRALDDFVHDSMAEFSLRHPNATPEEFAAAEEGTRTTAEKMLRAPNLGGADEQISRDSAEATLHNQEVIEVADDAGGLAMEREVVPSDSSEQSDGNPLIKAIEESKRRLTSGETTIVMGSNGRMHEIPAFDIEAEKFALAVNASKAKNSSTLEPITAQQVRNMLRQGSGTRAILESYLERYEADLASSETANEQEVKVDPHESNEQITPRRTAREIAAEVGVKDESELKQLGVLLETRETPRDQKHMLSTLIQRRGYHTTPDELLGIVRNYSKESIKEKEKGLLLHYHQTAINNLEGIVRERALLSQNERRARGEKFESTGARPDVVQMTRDKYDLNGNLMDAGLVESSGYLIAHGGLAFVFDESVIDEPDYDCIGKYPNLPSVPLDKLHAVVVDDEKDIPYVRDELTKGGINVAVVLRSDWLKNYNSARKPAP